MAQRGDEYSYRSKFEQELLYQIRGADLPEPLREHRVVPGRKFRFDFAWPETKFAVEVHGGIWVNGHHTRGRGFADDRIKMNYALIAGWRVMEFVTDDVRNGVALGWIKEFFRGAALGRYPIQGATTCPASPPPS